MTIPASDIVTVNPGVVGTGGSPLALNGVILSKNAYLPTAGVQTFASDDAVKDFFGPASEEYLLAQTYFLDGPNSISVGEQELAPPFVVEAIGDPATMAEAMRFRGGLVDRVKGRGARATVAQRDLITITALADVKPAEYSQPTR